MPVKLAEYRGARGDRDPIACVRALLEDLEAGKLKPTHAIIVLGTETEAGIETEVRAATPHHHDVFALLEMGRHYLLRCMGVA